jgi:Flp pilus assembly protein TadG
MGANHRASTSHRLEYRVPRAAPRDRTRRGATLVEAAVVLLVFVTLLLGTLDAALAVRQYNAVSQAARQGVREAIVRGEYAPPRRAAWGPATYSGTAADAHEIAQIIQQSLVGLDPGRVTILLTWPDGANTVGSRVRCTVATSYRPAVTTLFSRRELTFSATSTMLIAH